MTSSTAEPLPSLVIARHGETAWSRTGQHTGRTDLSLTPRGEHNARALAARLAAIPVDTVRTSPLQRAAGTCRLAGYGDRAVVDPDLLEWHYGDFEGLRSDEIRARHPGWDVFRDGCPGGESVADVSARADRLVERVRAAGATTLAFTSGHIARVIAARWIGLDPALVCRPLLLDTASVSILGFDRTRQRPVIRLWNDTLHLQEQPARQP